VDFNTVNDLQLEIGMPDIVNAIKKHRRFKAADIKIQVSGPRIRVVVDQTPLSKMKLSKTEEVATGGDPYIRLKHLKRLLPDIQVVGHPHAHRAIIKSDESTGINTLLVEGYGLRDCMITDGIVGTQTRTNNVMEAKDVLGIEAARSTIADEISLVMKDMDIDPRHMQLLADVMTYKGEVLGITRFGLAKMRDSVLQLASFEKTADHLFDAGGQGRTDLVEGVSECIIVGKSVGLGTGAMEVVRALNFYEGELGKKKTVFEDEWNDLCEAPSKVRGKKRRREA
ncbi:hypothetical protein KEM55_006924, partial [Ascosphaera atra]